MSYSVCVTCFVDSSHADALTFDTSKQSLICWKFHMKREHFHAHAKIIQQLDFTKKSIIWIIIVCILFHSRQHHNASSSSKNLFSFRSFVRTLYYVVWELPFLPSVPMTSSRISCAFSFKLNIFSACYLSHFPIFFFLLTKWMHGTMIYVSLNFFWR